MRAQLGHPNPLWVAWSDAVANGQDPAARQVLIERYAFAIPDDPALDAIQAVSSQGVIELGAGTGYWARLLIDRGTDVVAFDTAPAPSPLNTWFPASTAWAPVSSGDETSIDDFGERTLLLVWPTTNEDWAADAIHRFAAVGGGTLVYVGERFGGRTGDDRFHAMIGEVDRCWSCAYRTATSACVCGVIPLFRPIQIVGIPHWKGFEDDLRIFVRDLNAEPLSEQALGDVRRRLLGGRWRRKVPRIPPTA